MESEHKAWLGVFIALIVGLTAIIISTQIYYNNKNIHVMTNDYEYVTVTGYNVPVIQKVRNK